MIPLVMQSVVDSAMNRLHLPAVGVGEFITPAVALDFAQGGLEELTGLLTRLFGDTYFLRNDDVATQAGDDTISTPTNFATLESIQWIDGTCIHDVLPADFREYNPTPIAWSAYVACSMPKYRLEGATIVFTPIPIDIYTVRIRYTTGLFITQLADFISAQVGWKEYLICDFAERVRDRQEKDGSSWTQKKMIAEDKITEWAAKRDRNGGMQARDPRGALDRRHRDYTRRWLWR